VTGLGEPRGLLMDYGGVLTVPVGVSFAAWERAQGLEPGLVYRTLLAASDGEDGGVIGALERGELSDEAFDDLLGELLETVGSTVAVGAVLDGLFEGMLPAGTLWAVVRTAQRHGVRTGLLSNSWGMSAYPRERLAEHFDVTVISGEVGLRKPDPAIFHLAMGRLEVPASACAFVDDNEPNVVVAEQLGMFAVLHEGDDGRTVAALEDFLQVPL
jgi:epoxide hydrolase-like predicted phosphatase